MPAAELATSSAPAPLAGEVVYIFAFDIANELSRRSIDTLLNRPVEPFVVDASKRSPRGLFFYRPGMVRLDPVARVGPGGPVQLRPVIKLLPVGAISITVRVPFEVNQLGDLAVYHDLHFDDGTSLYDQVRQIAEDVRREIQPHLVNPVRTVADEEAYTVFCLRSPVRDDGGNEVPAETWLNQRRADVAALLIEETASHYISTQEAVESTSKSFSYYRNDLVVVDWDAAIVVDEPRYFDEVLHIMELANVQLTELEAYDRLLDNAVDRAYRDLVPRRWKSAHRKRTERDLQELRIDLARFSDELSNITKFFGDWHLARIYQGLSDRFHLGDWHRSIDEKLKTLDDLYQILRHEQTNRLMLVLETLIVILFVIDLIVLVMMGR